jgi:predicted lipoprotein
MRLLSVTAILLCLGGAAETKAADYASFNQAYAAQVIAPAFQTLETQADEFSKTVAAICAAPDAAGIDKILAGFNAVADAWMSAQQFRLGPLSEGQRAERFAYWPEKRNIVQKQLFELLAANDPAKLTPESFAQASVAVQGVTALERLLFETGARDALTGGDQQKIRCAVVTAIAVNLAAVAHEAAEGWKAALSDPQQAAAPFAANPAEATTQFYNNLLTELQIVGDQKIAAPLAASPAEAKPKLAEQWRSGRSLRNIILNLEAAKRAMFGAGAFETLLADPQSADLKARLAKAFDQAIVAAKDVPEPLDKAVVDPEARKKVELLFVRLNQLRDIAKQEMPAALGITLGFNELDGDGS